MDNEKKDNISYDDDSLNETLYNNEGKFFNFNSDINIPKNTPNDWSSDDDSEEYLLSKYNTKHNNNNKENEDLDDEDSLDETSDDKYISNEKLDDKNDIFYKNQKSEIKVENNLNRKTYHNIPIPNKKNDNSKIQKNQQKTEEKLNKIDNNIPLIMLMNELIQTIKNVYISGNMYINLDPEKISIDKNSNIIFKDYTNNLNRDYLYNLSIDSICYTAPELLHYMYENLSDSINKKNIIFSLGLFFLDKLSNNTYLKNIKNMFNEHYKNNPGGYSNYRMNLIAYLAKNPIINRKYTKKQNEDGRHNFTVEDSIVIEDKIDIKNINNFLPKNILENPNNARIIKDLQKKFLNMINNMLNGDFRRFVNNRSSIFELEEEFNNIIAFMLNNLKKDDGTNITAEDLLFFGTDISSDIKNKKLYEMKIFTEDNIKIIKDEVKNNIDLLLSEKENSKIKEYLEELKNCIEENGNINIPNNSFYTKLKNNFEKFNTKEQQQIMENLIKLKKLKIASIISEIEFLKKIASVNSEILEKEKELKKLYDNISLSTVVNIKSNANEFSSSYVEEEKLINTSKNNEQKLQNIEKEIQYIYLCTLYEKKEIVINLIESIKNNQETIEFIFNKAIEDKNLNVIDTLIKNKILKFNNIETISKCIVTINDNEISSKIINNLLCEIKDNEKLYSTVIKKIFTKADMENNNKIIEILFENIKQNINLFNSKNLFESLSGLIITSHNNKKYLNIIDDFINNLQNDELINNIFKMAYKTDSNDLIDKLIKSNKLKINNEIIKETIKNKKIDTAKLLIEYSIKTKEIIIKEKKKIINKEKNKIEERIKITEEDKKLFNEISDIVEEFAKNSENNNLKKKVQDFKKNAIKFSKKDNYFYIIKDNINNNMLYDLLNSLDSATKNININNQNIKMSNTHM